MPFLNVSEPNRQNEKATLCLYYGQQTIRNAIYRCHIKHSSSILATQEWAYRWIHQEIWVETPRIYRVSGILSRSDSKRKKAEKMAA